MAYRIEFTTKAHKQFRDLQKPIQKRLANRIDALANDPRPQGVTKLSTEESLYRVRAGDYRVIYQIQDKVLLVLIVGIGHRSDVYKGI